MQGLMLSEDEDDADAEYSSDVLRHLHETGKPMRMVGAMVQREGKRCMDFYHGRTDEDVQARKALKQAADAYQGTMDHLHEQYASEIKKREDALLAASKSSNDKDQKMSEQQAEIQRLQKQIEKQQNDAATQLAASQAAILWASRGSKLDPLHSLNMLINDMLQSLTDKHYNLSLLAAATQPGANVPVPKPIATVWLKQKNQNPTYLTERAVSYEKPRRGEQEGRWYFDASNKHQDPNAAAQLVEITDASIIAKLKTLGSFTTARKLFKPRIGNKCVYSFNNHTYEVEVVHQVTPWEEALYQQKLKQTSASQPSVASINKAMLLDGPFFRPSKADIDRYSTDLDTHSDMKDIVGHKQLAELATLWSSFSQGFKYDENLTEIWVKPQWLATWLNTLKFANDSHEIRVVGHGVRSGDFSSLAKDPRGFNLAMCNMGRANGDGSKGFGIYVSPLDAIPSEYTRVSGTQSPGTMVLGLLQVPRGQSQGQAATSTSSASYQAANGALEFYHLGSNMPNYLAANSSENDAYNVRDQTLFLALGKIVGK